MSHRKHTHGELFPVQTYYIYIYIYFPTSTPIVSFFLYIYIYIPNCHTASTPIVSFFLYIYLYIYSPTCHTQQARRR